MRHLLAMISLCAACTSANVAAQGNQQVLFETEIGFSKAGAVLSKQAQSVLDDVLDRSGAQDVEVIMAIGHTDNSVRGDKAQRLSIKRAEAVKTYLAKHGYERNRIYAEGKANRQPRALDANHEGAVSAVDNNRVQIQLVGPRVQPDPNEGT